MTTQISRRPAIAPGVAHELRFASLHNPGRCIVVPCDESGHVDIDSLPERLRVAYFGARAMLGREYLYPTVERAH
jgi:glycine cleavage system protein P-like pyridoxal-binding family